MKTTFIDSMRISRPLLNAQELKEWLETKPDDRREMIVPQEEWFDKSLSHLDNGIPVPWHLYSWVKEHINTDVMLTSLILLPTDDNFRHQEMSFAKIEIKAYGFPLHTSVQFHIGERVWTFYNGSIVVSDKQRQKIESWQLTYASTDTPDKPVWVRSSTTRVIQLSHAYENPPAYVSMLISSVDTLVRELGFGYVSVGRIENAYQYHMTLIDSPKVSDHIAPLAGISRYSLCGRTIQYAIDAAAEEVRKRGFPFDNTAQNGFVTWASPASFATDPVPQHIREAYSQLVSYLNAPLKKIITDGPYGNEAIGAYFLLHLTKFFSTLIEHFCMKQPVQEKA